MALSSAELGQGRMALT